MLYKKKVALLVASIINESNYSVSHVHETPSILYYRNIQQKLQVLRKIIEIISLSETCDRY